MSIMQDRAAAAVTQDINSRIANRVRTLRTDLNMTLDALAAKCDVSRSMISLVERGESSPTAVVLEKIASGLGVSLAALFDDSSAAANPVSRHDDRTPWRDPQSGYVRRNISPANFPSPIQIVEVVLPAGDGVAYETGARDVQAFAIHRDRRNRAITRATCSAEMVDFGRMHLAWPSTTRLVPASPLPTSRRPTKSAPPSPDLRVSHPSL